MRRNCVSSGIDYSLEEWTHVAVTFNEGVIKLYINGSVEGEDEVASPLAGNEHSIKVAADSAGQNLFRGIIDEVRIYGRALTEDEIMQNMNAEGLAVKPEDNLVSLWSVVKTSE
ncbi:hypothetical protein GF312_05720 [Candidatus Poribacteria bacterium]|nr:hypothetical protein [Candidatus Poribacteria bacterium]